MKLQSSLLVLALCVVQSGMARAQVTLREGSVALGYVGTTGNTQTSSLNIELLASIRYSQWLHNFKAQTLSSQEQSGTKAEHYFVEDKSDYNFDESQYLFVKGSYLDDRFSGYSYQSTATVGYGRYLLRSDSFTVQAFGGGGYSKSVPLTGDGKNEGVVTVGEQVVWTISASSRLVQSFNSDIGSSLTRSAFEIGLESKIINRVATKIAFVARNLSAVPAGKKKTDTQTSVSLVYAF